jgi:hypothetical protein
MRLCGLNHAQAMPVDFFTVTQRVRHGRSGNIAFAVLPVQIEANPKFAAGMHDVKDLLASVVEEPAAKSEKVSIELIFRPKFFEFVKRSIGFSQPFFGFFFDAIKAILASLLNKIDGHADELSTLTATEQGGSIPRVRWEIDLLTKACGSRPSD